MKKNARLVLWIGIVGCIAAIGCSAEQGTEAVAAKGEALMNNGGLGVAQCPGGGSPSCVACGGKDGFTCVSSCTGGFTCNIETDSCGELGGKCTTLGFGLFRSALRTFGGGLSRENFTAAP